MDKIEQKILRTLLLEVEESLCHLRGGSYQLEDHLEYLTSMFKKYNNSSKGLYITHKITSVMYDVKVLKRKNKLLSFFFSTDGSTWDVEIDNIHLIREYLEEMREGSFIREQYTSDIVTSESLIF